ncbi:DUF636 domain protein [Westerdykella ornata]|uniref:DUF636 domain protein n=1 Tax=Westerdykella ornata TaxID=318751 RepID=A0A6A6JJH4_WESOR|nr:DUF636 domain protein [Westerdykella ornata]KAF2276731.1 DUF636 domain protein [Westerdykella ornata]
MAKQGGCICRNVRFILEGDPVVKALCHCTDCRKITGKQALSPCSTYSTNVLYPDGQFKVTQGTPKQYSKIADSGKRIVIYFCGDCGSSMWRETESSPGIKVVAVGTLDDFDALEQAKPVAELFAPSRPSWIPAVEGAEQRQAM